MENRIKGPAHRSGSLLYPWQSLLKIARDGIPIANTPWKEAMSKCRRDENRFLKKARTKGTAIFLPL